MSTLEINITDPAEIEVGAQGLNEILQNVRIIVTTRKGSVPLDRDFGVSWQMVDQPTPRARAELTAEIFQAVSKYEPRARVTRVEFDQTADDEMDGILTPRVQVEIKA